MQNGIKRKAEDASEEFPKRKKYSQPLIAPPPGLEIPDGWLDCPPFGHNLRNSKIPEGVGIIPCKVPLGPKFQCVVGNKAFTPKMLLEQLRKKGYEVGLVIDLTNSYRYYDPGDFMTPDRSHLKIQCRGRGETPTPEDVNIFCFEVLKFKRSQEMAQEMENQEAREQGRKPNRLPVKHIVVHCTHGFNRTGFMLTSFMARYEEMSLALAVKTFKAFRPPGIYKDDYISTLYSYYHEVRDVNSKTPPVPDWKQEEKEDELELTVDDIEEAQEEELKHDDEIGEAISEEEESNLQQMIIQLVRGASPEQGRNPRFPGSQPVSLARANLDMLNNERYWVTWKADGTRYLLLLLPWGAYFMDRTFKVRRMQMRFPHPDLLHRHHFTVLDGEMVVDEDIETGKQYRRFLAYDMMVLHQKSYVNQPFETRWQMLEASVINPRRAEKAQIEKALHEKKPTKIAYKYDLEGLGVRRKGFWPLPVARQLLDTFIPNLSHECDGLILQPAESEYKTGTCNDLLKWKFSHLNSVDFLLRISPTGERQLALLETRGGGYARTVNLPGAKLSIGDDDASEFVDKIIECSWDKEQQMWRFMRDRRDKDTPNAYHVYEKVMKSIEDNIQENDLLEAIESALKNPIYAKDVPSKKQ